MILKNIVVGCNINIIKICGTEIFNKPPSRYNEASLISYMEKIGIGRPSTYHTFIPLLEEREYITISNSIGYQKNINTYMVSPPFD